MTSDKDLLNYARQLTESAEEFYTNLLAYDRVDIDTLNYIEHIVNRIRSLTTTGI